MKPIEHPDFVGFYEGFFDWEKSGFIGDFIHEEIGISWDFMEI